LYSSPRELLSQNFFIHWRNSRLSCILHLSVSVDVAGAIAQVGVEVGIGAEDTLRVAQLLQRG
jgi:hypothetical protein